MQSDASPGTSASGKYRHLVFCFLPQLLFGLLALGVYGGGYWLSLPLLFLLAVVPLLDLLTGWQDNGHFDKNDFSPFEISLLHWNTRLYALFYMGAVVYFAMSIHRFNAIEISLILVSSSLLGGIGFAAAHELLHAKEKSTRSCSVSPPRFCFSRTTRSFTSAATTFMPAPPRTRTPPG